MGLRGTWHTHIRYLGVWQMSGCVHVEHGWQQMRLRPTKENYYSEVFNNLAVQSVPPTMESDLDEIWWQLFLQTSRTFLDPPKISVEPNLETKSSKKQNCDYWISSVTRSPVIFLCFFSVLTQSLCGGENNGNPQGRIRGARRLFGRYVWKSFPCTHPIKR